MVHSGRHPRTVCHFAQIDSDSLYCHHSVAFTIHTDTSWLLPQHRPGWDSTSFGAYFISGAFWLVVAP
jgi:hypothetical protein